MGMSTAGGEIPTINCSHPGNRKRTEKQQSTNTISINDVHLQMCTYRNMTAAPTGTAGGEIPTINRSQRHARLSFSGNEKRKQKKQQSTAE